MKSHRSLLTVVVALGALLLMPALAQADAGAAIVRQCLNAGKVSGNYSQQAYSQALRELPADVAEYSDCPNLIRAAMQAAAARGGSGLNGASAGGVGGTGGAAGGGPGTPLSAPEKAALAAAAHPAGGSPGVQVGDQLVHPGLVHVNIASALNRLPTPLLVLLAVLAAGALFGAGRLAHQRVAARRGL